jgi:hypothetical protein
MIMNKLRMISAVLAMVIIVGCATTVLERKIFKGYTVGNVLTASIGTPFLVDQDGTVETVKSWVGILNSPDGWKIEKRYSADFVRKELIYAGKSGTTVEISYREFRGGLAAPAFYQNLKYDLSESKSITFQNFQIEIINASNQSITYKVLRD